VRDGRSAENAAVLDAVEREIREILATDTLPDRSRFYLKHTLASLLIIHDTPEELNSRHRLLAELESDPELRRTPGFIHHKIALLDDTLHVDEALRTIDTALPLLKAHGLMVNYSMDRLRQLCLNLALDGDRERAISALPDLLRSDANPRGVRPLIAAVRLTLTAMLLGDIEWGVELQEKLVAERSEGYFFINIEEAIRSEQSESALQEVYTEFIANPYTLAMPEYGAFRALFRCALRSADADVDAASDAVRRIMRNPVCDQEKILIRNSAITLAEYIERSGANPRFLMAFATDIHDSLLQTLVAFAERSLPNFMRPMLERHVRYFTEQEIGEWRVRIAALAQEREGEDVDGGDQRLHVQMLGAVQIQLPGKAPARIKGSRNRLLLALLVANRMLPHPLDHAEFCSLATCIGDYHQQARRAANVAVHRLRELLGPDAVLTDEEIPRLNPERVEVDLLRADTRLRESLLALREGNLARAVPAVTEALMIVGNDIPFPAFYDDFFEAAREDFSARLRSAVLRIVRSLLHERDAAAAERLLRTALAAMPGDAELADLLRRALITLDQRTEAERIRRKIEDQEVD
jgi:DNA-binding SARP family transcriptional activator